MKNGTYYLNNTGSRWTTYPKEKLTFETKSGKTLERTPLFFEQFGNFAVVCISYKGKKIKVFADQKLED
jgi:hypothetical protein